MAQGLDQLPISVCDIDAADAASLAYDVAIWAAGYESRAGWLVTSEFRPMHVGQWLRVEFLECREVWSAPTNLKIGLGTLLGSGPGRAGWDGHWTTVWHDMIVAERNRLGRRLKIFVDYSSMPRTVYGTLLLESLRRCRACVESLVLAYVPGVHSDDLDGSRSIEGLRTLIGTEGTSEYDRDPAFVVGLGYDGILAEAVVDLFQVAHFSCFYADPGVDCTSVERALGANAGLLSRSELVAASPAWAVLDTMEVVLRLCEWYSGRRDVIVVPMGPKPHVLASILATCAKSHLGLRLPKLSSFRPVEVTVRESSRPFVTRVSLHE